MRFDKNSFFKVQSEFSVQRMNKKCSHRQTSLKRFTNQSEMSALLTVCVTENSSDSPLELILNGGGGGGRGQPCCKT